MVLKELGGSEDIDSEAIIRYFEPLIEYLDQALGEADQCIGWGGMAKGGIRIYVSIAMCMFICECVYV